MNDYIPAMAEGYAECRIFDDIVANNTSGADKTLTSITFDIVRNGVGPTLSVGLAGHIYSVEAAPDSATGIESASGGDNVLNVLSGDTIGGVAATIGNATLAVASGSSVPAGLTFDTATGNVDVLAGTAPNSDSFDYEI